MAFPEPLFYDIFMDVGQGSSNRGRNLLSVPVQNLNLQFNEQFVNQGDHRWSSPDLQQATAKTHSSIFLIVWSLNSNAQNLPWCHRRVLKYEKTRSLQSLNFQIDLGVHLEYIKMHEASLPLTYKDFCSEKSSSKQSYGNTEGSSGCKFKWIGNVCIFYQEVTWTTGFWPDGSSW